MMLASVLERFRSQGPAAGELEGDRQISLGIVGAGEIVEKAHLPTLFAMDNVRVAWLTGVDPHKAKSVARAYGVPYWPLSSNLEDLPDAEVILLAIPYGAREPYYSAMRERSSALYVEKPFSRAVQHHLRLCEWFPAYRLGCGFQRRSLGATSLMKNLIESSLFGPPRRVRFGWGGPGITVGGKYGADIQLAGGGPLFENGVHGIDALLFCCGAVAADVYSVKMIMDGDFDIHTSARLHLRREEGPGIECELTVSCLEETINCLEFYFDHAMVSFSLFSPDRVSVWPLLTTGSEKYELSVNTPVTVLQSLYSHWQRFLLGVNTKRVNWTSASETILTTKVIEELYQKGAQRLAPQNHYLC